MNAAASASAMSAYHIHEKSPKAVSALPPSHAPKNPPIWCVNVARPNKVAR